MAVAIAESRPPFVRFEVRTMELRDESLKAGHFMGTDVDYVLVTPIGSKDVFEQVATEWLSGLEKEVREERFPGEWLEKYKAKYAMWKAGQEAPVDGMHLKLWPIIRPAQLRTCLAVGIYSIEDLASSNEEAIQSIGMGGRQLREQAQTWLKQAAGPGVAAGKIAALEAENSALRIRNDSLEAQLSSVSTRISALEDRTSAPSTSIGLSDVLDAPKAVPPISKAIPSVKRL